MSDNRRSHHRVAGPFDGRRLGPLKIDVQIYDLSVGGCFINSFQDPDSGRQLWLEIHLPDEGWITVKAETLYVRSGFGFAVRFIELTDEARASLTREIEKLRASNQD